MTTKPEMIREHIGRKIWELQNSPDASAQLAKLRRGVGKVMENSPESWAIILSDLPQELLGKGRGDQFEPSASENAIHVSLGLFALHCRGNDVVDVSSEGSFARACRRLVDPSRSNEVAVSRCFDAILSADSFEELTYHVRGMVAMMASSSPTIGFDYRSFAEDLYNIQFPDGRRRTLLRWGQDFYVNHNKQFSVKEEKE